MTRAVEPFQGHISRLFREVHWILLPHSPAPPTPPSWCVNSGRSSRHLKQELDQNTALSPGITLC